MLDAQRMIREARALVKLDAFDSADVEYHLGRLVDAVNTETTLSSAGEQRFHIAGVYLLCNRLLLNQFLQENPDCRDKDIGAAIIIVGLPRTGSTKLQRLIAQDRRLDHMTLLDVVLPLRFPGEQDIEHRLRLIGAMERELGQPELVAGHNLTIAEPEEELELQKSHFTKSNMRDHASIPRWERLVESVDVPARYKMVRQFIVANKLQRNRNGMAWIFKNAYAGEDLDVIAESFPNAKFVFTHRDPAQQLGSITALGHKWRAFHSDVVDKQDTGAQYLDFWSRFMNRTLAACTKIPASRLLHVRYKDTLANPVKVVADVYNFCGYTLTSEAERAILEYDARNQQHQHGLHSYTLEEFGLSREQINEAFADYIAMYGEFI